MKRTSTALIVVTLLALSVLLRVDSATSSGTSEWSQVPAPPSQSGAAIAIEVGLSVAPEIIVPIALSLASVAVAYARDSNGASTLDTHFSLIGAEVTAQADKSPDAVANAKAQSWIPLLRKNICTSTPTWVSAGPGPGRHPKRAIAFCKGGSTVGFTWAEGSIDTSKESIDTSFDATIGVDLGSFFLGASPGEAASFSLDITDLAPNQVSEDVPPEIYSGLEEAGVTPVPTVTSYLSLQVSFAGGTSQPTVTAKSFGTPMPDVEDDFQWVDGDPPGIQYQGGTIEIPVTLPLETPVNLDTQMVAGAAGPGIIGGIADFPDVAASSLETADSLSGSSSPPYAPLMGVAAAAVALGAGGWYARRRWLR